MPKFTPRSQASAKARLPKKKSPINAPAHQLLMQEFVEHLPDAVYFKDTRGRYIYVNAAMSARAGRPAEFILGKTDDEIFPHQLAQKLQKYDRHVIKTGRVVADKVEQEIDGHNDKRYLSVMVIPRMGRNKKCLGIMGITRDVTKRLQFERLREEWLLLEKKLVVLEDMNRVKTDFISAVSHEIRTPLAIVKQLFLLIYDETAGPVNNQQRELLVKANNNIDRLQHIIEELLDISRIEGQKFALSYSLVKLNEMIRDAVPFFKKFASERRITLTYKLPQEEVNLFADAERLQQILTNLINNAIKFTPDGGNITIEVKMLAVKVRVGIRDSGEGIRPEDLDRIFDRFVQISSDDGAKKKGIGLGLTIVKALVEKHGGEIWVESQSGKGSCFYFTLPRFYTANVLQQPVRDKINALLAHAAVVSLINVVIVNLEDFKRRVDIDTEKFFRDIREIVLKTGKGVFQNSSDKDFVFVLNASNGSCSIFFPYSAEEEKIFCDLIRQGIKSYFMQNSLNDVFIALGLLSYSSGLNRAARSGEENFHAQEIYIGSEMRLFKRIKYHIKAEIIFPDKTVQLVFSQDLSLGGICLDVQVPLKTDVLLTIVFPLLKTNKKLKVLGRVAWVRQGAASQAAIPDRYKVGVEFVDLKVRARAMLAKELKLYYE